MFCIITCLNYVFSKLMFFLFFIGNFDIFYCSNYFILFFIIVGFTYFVLQFRVNSINPISFRLNLSVKQLTAIGSVVPEMRRLISAEKADDWTCLLIHCSAHATSSSFQATSILLMFSQGRSFLPNLTRSHG